MTYNLLTIAIYNINSDYSLTLASSTTCAPGFTTYFGGDPVYELIDNFLYIGAPVGYGSGTSVQISKYDIDNNTASLIANKKIVSSSAYGSTVTHMDVRNGLIYHSYYPSSSSSTYYNKYNFNTDTLTSLTERHGSINNYYHSKSYNSTYIPLIVGSNLVLWNKSTQSVAVTIEQPATEPKQYWFTLDKCYILTNTKLYTINLSNLSVSNVEFDTIQLSVCSKSLNCIAETQTHWIVEGMAAHSTSSGGNNNATLIIIDKQTNIATKIMGGYSNPLTGLLDGYSLLFSSDNLCYFTGMKGLDKLSGNSFGSILIGSFDDFDSGLVPLIPFSKESGSSGVPPYTVFNITKEWSKNLGKLYNE